MKEKIYIAGPLFSKAEKDFNLDINSYLNDIEHPTFLPQEDGFDKASLVEKITSSSKDAATKEKELAKLNADIFSKDIGEIENSDLLLIILDGRVPDEGACVELGYAHAQGKVCIGLKTDSRTLQAGQDNPMITGCINKLANSKEDLGKILDSYRAENAGWKTIGVKVRIDELAVLNRQLNRLNYNTLGDLVKDLIAGKITHVT
jgi:nucleoside 2-deoxyribosyltransferase